MTTTTRVPFLRRIISEDLAWVSTVRRDIDGRFRHCDPRTGEVVVRATGYPSVPRS